VPVIAGRFATTRDMPAGDYHLGAVWHMSPVAQLMNRVVRRDILSYVQRQHGEGRPLRRPPSGTAAPSTSALAALKIADVRPPHEPVADPRGDRPVVTCRVGTLAIQFGCLMVGDSGIEPVTPTVSTHSRRRRQALVGATVLGLRAVSRWLRPPGDGRLRPSCGLAADRPRSQVGRRGWGIEESVRPGRDHQLRSLVGFAIESIARSEQRVCRAVNGRAIVVRYSQPLRLNRT
jgi:hypothetical protein